MAAQPRVVKEHGREVEETERSGGFTDGPDGAGGVEGSPPAWSGHADPLCLKEDAGGLVR